MFLEEAIKKTAERMKEFAKAYRNSPSLDTQEVGDETVEKLREVWRTIPTREETGADVAYDRMRRRMNNPFFAETAERPRPSYIPGDDGVVWLDGGIATTSAPATKPQEFELTNELYHLIIDCTEIILDYCRARNIRPNYDLNVGHHQRNTITVGIGGRGGWTARQPNHYRLESKDGLPGLEEFLRRVYE